MKKIVILMMCILVFSSCSKNEKDYQPVIHSGYEMTADSTADVDLTIMSSTMIYAEVNAMMTEPEKYEGKVIKMNGTFSSFTDESTQNTYYACIIKDATACCAQGLEFLPIDDSKHPEDGDNLTVKGVFETYEENGYYYCRLRDAVIM